LAQPGLLGVAVAARMPDHGGGDLADLEGHAALGEAEAEIEKWWPIIKEAGIKPE